MPSALIIGYGSIGQRHAKLLSKAGLNVSLVSSQSNLPHPTFVGIDQAIDSQNFSLVIIASPTNRHLHDLQLLANTGYASRVIIEKPIFDNATDVPAFQFKHLLVGYNLRFHPLMRQLKALLVGKKIVSICTYAGSYLPEWRPGRDYRDIYSAERSMGGGVMRDLSHEIDYTLWLGGHGSHNISGLFGHFSDLKVNAEDVACLTFSTKHCPACVCYISFADVVPRRKVIVNTVDESYELDLVANCLRIGAQETSLDIDRNYTYERMHEAVLEDDTEDGCGLGEAIEVLNLINQLESRA